MDQQKKYRILRLDPKLEPYAQDIALRMNHLKKTRSRLLGKKRKLSTIATGHLYYGFHPSENGWVYREWAPAADEITVFGDFNEWDRESHSMTRVGDNWEIHVPGPIPHGSRVRIRIKSNGTSFERIPLYAKRVTQETNRLFNGVIWHPENQFQWTDSGFKPSSPLMIYECHVGMAGEKEGVTTFTEFTRDVLPRIKKLGYNAVQIMAVMEHPYYGSFGYQVTNFYAVSSRFGTPEEFMALVDTAHSMGIAVIMDIVHSHVAKNTAEGLAEFDGTDWQFCHSGPKGDHPAWKTRLFNYGKDEVIHFLLSNVHYWMAEYHLDGFRFDGVTSMLYFHHGLGVAFTDYSQYFTMATDLDAITYLQLATQLVREVNPNSILISEDMSGMPGMALPVEDGGIGFDYRLGMGLPDYFIKMLKEQADEEWDMGTLWYELTTRRPGEKVIGYCESHDQALVGDKTIMFRLADKEMYWHMGKHLGSEIIERAMCLHKMIRLITCAFGGDGYLNFMGNEFGHPEWIDFPREGNHWSYHHARRQWSLADNPFLFYECLQNFDTAMIMLMRRPDIPAGTPVLLKVHEANKIIAAVRGNYTFLFNFHPNKSYLHELSDSSRFEIVLHSAWQPFGGFIDQTENSGILRSDGVIVDRRSALVLRYLG